MAIMYPYTNFDEVALACTGCGWKGTGAEVYIYDLYGVARAKEIHCPKCDRFLGNRENEKPPSGESADQLSFQLG